MIGVRFICLPVTQLNEIYTPLLFCNPLSQRIILKSWLLPLWDIYRVICQKEQRRWIERNAITGEIHLLEEGIEYIQDGTKWEMFR